MRKNDIINIIREKLPEYSKKDIEIIVNEFLETVKQQLIKKETIEIRGFGTFAVKIREAGFVRNPKTGEKFKVDRKFVPYFKPGTIIKKMVDTGQYFKIQKKFK